jgi:trehalose-phosphatase
LCENLKLIHPCELTQRFLSYEKILLLLDYDGTLVPLEADPTKAQNQHQLLELLSKLQLHPKIDLVIVSGRNMEDLQQLCPLPNLSIASDHGARLQWRGQQCFWFGDLWAIRQMVTQIYSELKKQLQIQLGEPANIGLIVQDKPLSVCMHYRLANPAHQQAALKIFKALAPTFDPQHTFHFIHGKFMLEFRPEALHKGVPIRYLLDNFFAAATSRALFIGDDRTDEDGFKELPPHGIGVRVGTSINSTAEYYFEHQKEVRQFLENLLEKLEVVS